MMRAPARIHLLATPRFNLSVLASVTKFLSATPGDVSPAAFYSGCLRGFAAAAEAAASRTPPGIFEFRTSIIYPHRMSAYLAACAVQPWSRVDPGFLGFWVTDAGGDQNEVTRVHHYADYDARDASRAELAANSTWHAFLDIEKNSVASERSEIYLSADACLVASGAPQGASAASVAGAACASSSDSAAGVFEMRTYQLELGYNPVPKLIGHMVEGLPSKLASDPDELGALVGMFYSDVGRLNRFVEVWRYPSFQDHIRVREAARTAIKWRETIGAIAPMVQMFETKLCIPATFSPLR